MAIVMGIFLLGNIVMADQCLDGHYCVCNPGDGEISLLFSKKNVSFLGGEHMYCKNTVPSVEDLNGAGSSGKSVVSISFNLYLKRARCEWPKEMEKLSGFHYLQLVSIPCTVAFIL